MAQVTRRAARSLLVGVVTVAVVAFLLYLALGAQMQGRLPWQATTQVEIEFKNVGTLAAGDEVRENGVQIGRVSDVFLDDGTTVVRVQLEGDVPVYSDARAIISDKSALAARYVELHRGSPGSTELKEGERITVEQTMSATDLGNLLDVFDEQTRTQLKSAVGELGRGAAGQSKNLHAVLEKAPALLTDASTVTSALASPEADLASLLNNVEDLTTEFQGRGDDISKLVTGLDKTLRALNVDDGKPLTMTVDELPAMLDTARANLKTLDAPLADTESAVKGLREGTAALGEATPDLRGFLRESVEPLTKVPGVVDQATPAVKDLTRTVADLRPLAPNLSEGLSNAVRPLEVLAPYAPDLVTLAQRGRSFTSATVGGEHVARIGINITPGSVLGSIDDPGFQRDVYPEPGGAEDNEAESLIRPNAGGRN